MNAISPSSLINGIIKTINNGLGSLLVHKFNFDTSLKNELLFFLKPECFLYSSNCQRQRLLEMIMEKFQHHEVDVSGALYLGGNCVERLAIMDRHYGYINRLSKHASEILKQESPEFKLMLERLESISENCEDLLTFRVLGGHEFLKQYPTYDENTLNELWNTKPSLKLRSGFYFQAYQVDSTDTHSSKKDGVILANGFHPFQLRHFTHPEHKLIILLLHSNRPWQELKFSLAGDTYPEKADKNSIRGHLFQYCQEYGIPSISISANGIHLSAGPFEALYEIYNFLRNFKESGYHLEQTNMARILKQMDFSFEEICRCLANPLSRIENKITDLYSATENMDSPDAVILYKQYFHNKDTVKPAFDLN